MFCRKFKFFLTTEKCKQIQVQGDTCDFKHKEGLHARKTAAAIILHKENPLDDGLVGCIFRVIKLFVLIKRFCLQVLLNEKLF